MSRGRVKKLPQALQAPARLATSLLQTATRTPASAARELARARWMLADGRGGAPRLPPGSLRPSALRGIEREDFYRAKARANGEIFKLFWGSGDLKICLTGFELARRLLSEHRHALTPVNIDIHRVAPKGFLRCMAGDDHASYRRLFNRALGDNLVAAWDAPIRAIIQHELGALADASVDGVSNAAQLVQTLSRVTTRIFVLLFLGIDDRHPACAAVLEGFNRLGPHALVHPLGDAQVAAFHDIHATLATLIEQRPGDRAADSENSVLGRLAQSDADALADPTVIGNVVYMLEMGRHDVRGLLRWIIKYLGASPALHGPLREQGRGAPAATSLARACVMETLRLDQAEVLNRRAVEEFVFAGWRIPRDSHVCILLRETHRDPRVFERPDDYHPRRFLERNFSNDEYAPFGIGEHRCIAVAVVNAVCTLFVEELAAEFDWRITADGERVKGPYHWTPAEELAIAIVRAG